MSYTLSFDSSTKVKRGEAKGLLNHNLRDVMEANGFCLEHSNENIDPNETKNNMSLYFDQTEMKFKACTDIEQAINSLETRLATVKKPMRKDAVICRGLILQLDPEFYESATEDEKSKSYGDMLSWAKSTFGSKNIVAVSVHVDEANPHMHLLFTPVTDDGRLSQKDWFPDPMSLGAMHEDFRQHMRQHGYSITHDRQPKRKHMSVKEYKAFRGAEEKAVELRDWELDLKRRITKVNDKEADLETRESDLKTQTEALRLDADKVIQQLDKKQQELNITLQEVLQEVKQKPAYIDEFFKVYPTAKEFYDKFKVEKEQDLTDKVKPSPYVTKFLKQHGYGYSNGKLVELDESLLPKQQLNNNLGMDF